MPGASSPQEDRGAPCCWGHPRCGGCRGCSRAGAVPGSGAGLSRGPVSPQPLLECHLVGAARQHRLPSAPGVPQPSGSVSQGWQGQRGSSGVRGGPGGPQEVGHEE